MHRDLEAARTELVEAMKAYDDSVVAGDSAMISVRLQLAYEAALKVVEAAEGDPALRAYAVELAKDLDTWRRHNAEQGLVSEDLLWDVFRPWPK